MPAQSPIASPNSAIPGLEAISIETMRSACQRLLAFLPAKQAVGILVDFMDPDKASDEEWAAVWLLLRPREKELAQLGLGRMLAAEAQREEDGFRGAQIAAAVASFLSSDSSAAIVSCRRFAESIGQPSWIRWIGETARREDDDDFFPGKEPFEAGRPFGRECAAVFERSLLSRLKAVPTPIGREALRPWIEDFLAERAQQGSESWQGWSFLEIAQAGERLGIFSEADFARFIPRFCEDSLAAPRRADWLRGFSAQALLAGSESMMRFGVGLRAGLGEPLTEREWATALGAGAQGAQRAQTLLARQALSEESIERMLRLKALKGSARAALESRSLRRELAAADLAAQEAPANASALAAKAPRRRL